MLSNTLDKISFWCLFLVVILLPVFFLPFIKIPVETSKGLLFVLGLSLSLIFWTAARFSDGKIVLPKTPFFFTSLFVIVAFLLSALFSPVKSIAFFGTMLDNGSFYFILGAFLLMFMSSIVFNDLSKVKKVLKGFFVSGVLLLFFQGLRLFMPKILSFGILNLKTENVLGSWNAFGLFAGLILLTSLFILEFFNLKKLHKIFLIVSYVLALFATILVNFSVIWAILGIFALIIFVYKASLMSTTKQEVLEENKENFPALTFVTVLLSIMFFISGQFIGNFLPEKLNALNTEIRPSFVSTTQVLKSALVQDPVLGFGLNRFGDAWALYKPDVVNMSLLWDAYFDNGVGTLFSFAVTTGILGIISLLAFILHFIWIGFSSVFKNYKKKEIEKYLFLIFLFILYLLTSAMFYAIGMVLFLLCFIFIGIFIGLYSHSKNKGTIVFSFLNDPRKSFFSILVLVALAVLTFSVTFKYTEKFISLFYYHMSLSAKDINKSEIYINKALNLHKNDFYYRIYSQIYSAKVSGLLNKTELSDLEKNVLKQSFDNSLNGLRNAILVNPNNYLNHRFLGDFYRDAGSLGVDGSFDQSIISYNNALNLNPRNPGLKLDIANVYYRKKEFISAKQYAEEALVLKPNFTEALLFLSSMHKELNQKNEALFYAERALSLDPNNIYLMQYLDSVKKDNNTLPVVTEEAEKKTE